jgi:hypothetical protein
MTVKTTPVSLSVRPFQVSHLCFEVGGIVEVVAAQLGAQLKTAFDFPAFYTILGSRPTLPATGSITFTTNPVAGTRIVLNGSIWLFVNSLAPPFNELLIGPTLDKTLAAAVGTLQASTDTDVKKFIYATSSTVLSLTAATGGSGGNALTISTTVSGATASGSTLSGGDSSLLLYNFLEIEAAAAPFALVALRKEARKAALNNAINARQNAYFAKYANAPAIIAQMNQSYSPSIVGSKLQRLEVLAGIATTQFNLLKAAYTSDPTRNPGGSTGGLVKNTNSAICSDTASYGYSATGGIAEEISVGGGNINEQTPIPAPPDPPGPWTPPSWPSPCSLSGQSNGPGDNLASPKPPPAPVDSWTLRLPASGQGDATIQKGMTYQATSNADKARQSQTIINTDYGFRVPYSEAAAQFERAQISLIDQEFQQFMYTQNFPNLATVFANELNSIDSNVFRLQIAFLDTILMSPITGIVTGIYKNPGDAVKAGEPVVRVEDNSTIYLVATLIHRGPIVIGVPPPLPPPANSTVTVETSLFGASGPKTSLTGSVVSARGHRDDDKWDLVVKCTNPLDAFGNPTFPLGYHFDYDDTTVSIK